MKSSLVIALLLAVPAAANAGEQTEEAKRAAELVRSRFLGQWAYVPVTLVPGPFISTYAGSTTGLGQWKVDLSLDSPRNFGLKTTGLAYSAVAQRFDAQIGIAGALGIRGHIEGEAIVPNDLSSAFGVPVSGTTGGGGGLVLALLSGDRLKLSLTADYAALQQSLVSPALSLSQSVQTFDLSKLRSTQTNQDLIAGGSLALAFTDWLGFVGEAGWEGRWMKSNGALADPGTTLDFLVLTAALSMNTWRQTVPVGFTLFFRDQLPLGDTPYINVRQFGGGLFYTGRPYIDLGLEVFTLQDQRKVGQLLRSVGRTYLAPRLQVYF